MATAEATKFHLLTTRQAARRLGLSPGTLQNWRWCGRGPTYVRLGRAVRYLETDLEQFAEAGRAGK